MQMWKAEYSPRNIIPWSIILACYTACPLILIVVWYFLKRENARRDALPASPDQGFGFVDEVQEDGFIVARKVDLSFLDVTDRKNPSFRSVPFRSCSCDAS